MIESPAISPREAARAFTPELTELIEAPLYAQVWADDRLSARDRSLVTLGAVVALDRPDELRAQLRRAVDNGLTRDEISAAQIVPPALFRPQRSPLRGRDPHYQ